MKEQECIQALDQILARHLSRLIGSAHGVHGLPLTMTTITALVLIWEKEQGAPALAAAPQRYTREELIQEMEELGLRITGPQAQQFELLFAKGYLMEGEDGAIIPLEPAVKTARLLNVLFRGMPGMSLVAYLAQLYLEVTTGHKEMALAMESVDTTLRNIGVETRSTQRPRAGGNGVSMAQVEEETRLRSQDLQREGAPPPPRPTGVELEKVKETLHRWRERSRRQGPKLITADGRAKVIKSKPKRRAPGPSAPPPPNREPQRPAPPPPPPAEASTPQPPPSPEESPPPLPPEAPGPEPRTEAAKEPEVPLPPEKEPLVQEQGPEPTVEPPRPEAPEELEAGHEGLKEGQPAAQTEGEEPESATPQEPPSAVDEEDGQSTPEPQLQEEDIEEKIAAFQKKKALRCPECATGKLQENTTGGGKRFFSCTNPGCHFISWGPPIYVPCPRCKAKYTIEMVDGDKRWLECVNAACGFRQSHPDDAPKKRRRVVRKRVVRRKKKR